MEEVFVIENGGGGGGGREEALAPPTIPNNFFDDEVEGIPVAEEGLVAVPVPIVAATFTDDDGVAEDLGVAITFLVLAAEESPPEE